MDDLLVTFTSKLWLYQGGKASWHFITLPKEAAEQITFFAGHRKAGWGSVRVKVTIGTTTWGTSIFPESKSGSYILPIKADVRKKEGLSEGVDASVKLVIEI